MFLFPWGVQPPASSEQKFKYRSNIIVLASRLLIFKCLLTALLIISEVSANIQNPYDEIKGVVGDMTRLQCKAMQHRKGYNPVLVLWYKDGARQPFFTLDLRNEGPEEFFDNEMRSRVNSDVTGEFLTLRSLISSDSAQYKCKVDYDNSPSLEATVNLIVFEPPTQISIQDESKRIYPGPVLGPINQGSNLRLFCIAVGGNPTPGVSWWMGSVLLTDRSYSLGAFLASHEEDLVPDLKSSVSSNSGSSSSFSLGSADGENINAPRVVSELNIPNITRTHAGANITCRASNNNISAPLGKTLSLNVYLRPATVDIIAPKEPFREGVPSRLQCQTSGSYPSAKISWEKSKNGKPVILESSQTSFRDGKSIAWLNITPEADDHGAILTCHAHNPDLPGKGTQKSTVLQVQFAPRVTLQLGKNLAHQAIKEGVDVYFECEIASNPRPKSITWYKDKLNQIDEDLKAGVLLSGENLVLQRIHRKFAGNYTCTVANELGETTSNVVELPIMFLPVCSTDLVTVAVAEGEGVRLNCRVEARPTDLLRYVWYFNNTIDTVEVGVDRIKIEDGVSFIDYTPLSQRDYGTLSCWATNEVGMQAEPCRFLVTEAGPPEPVKNCVLVNHTVGTLEVRCSPGNDGGSPQRFVAKVFVHSTPKNILLAEFKSPTPRFHVGGLTPGQDYQITITAVNNKGASAPEEIDAIRLKVAEKRMGDVKAPPVSPLVGVFLGLVGGFVLLLLVGLLLSRARSNRSSCWRQGRDAGGMDSAEGGPQGLEVGVNMGDNSLQKTPSHIHTHVSSSSISRAMQDEDDESPDLVKSSNETSQLLDSHKCPDMITRRLNYTQPTSGPLSSPLGGTNLGPFLDSQSPRHLPNDESFV